MAPPQGLDQGSNAHYFVLRFSVGKVHTGSCTCVAFLVGEATQLGQIMAACCGEAAGEEEAEKTPLARRLDTLAEQIGQVWGRL